MNRKYRSRHHPNNGVTYTVTGNMLFASTGSEYGPDCWDWSDLEEID